MRRAMFNTDWYPHAGSPASDAKKSQSLLWPRAQIIALMLDPPPKPFPIPKEMARPLSQGFGSVLNSQYRSLPMFLIHWRASMTLGDSSSPPSSSSRTFSSGFSAILPATTEPEEPEPQTMKS